MAHEAKKERIVVAMSGGVDSSVTALLLKQQGYDVVGISMRLWSYEPEATHGCCTPEDLYDARRAADQIGIPHYVANFEESFESSVVADFVKGYQRGETPNPCVRCNQGVKFHTLLKRASELGATYLATGHYARRVKTETGYKLFRAVEQSRDQSYFLYGMDQSELARILFPLGELTKDEVREIGRQHGLGVADKGDSQEICFVSGSYADFVEKRLSSSEIRRGEIRDETGKTLGHHEGIHRFTIGQRKGLGIQSLLPRFVTGIDPAGDVTVGAEENLMKTTFRVRELRWVGLPPELGRTYDIQIRSRFSPAKGEIADVNESNLTLRFLTPQRAITPGQAAVVYADDEVIGGGWIDQVFA